MRVVIEQSREACRSSLSECEIITASCLRPLARTSNSRPRTVDCAKSHAEKSFAVFCYRITYNMTYRYRDTSEISLGNTALIIDARMRN